MSFGLRMLAQAMYLDLVRGNDEVGFGVMERDLRLKTLAGFTDDTQIVLAQKAAAEAFDDHASPAAREQAKADLLRRIVTAVAAMDGELPW